ncbi:MAG: cytidine deaminase [Lachnospiraceae bacterium]|nr:cytidine deaminase [Lachnospiraceae bacterium]
MTKEVEKKLIETALEYRKRAYSPYSEYKVGAALLAKNGTIYGGCNVENAAYTPTNCAERTAFFKAVSEGVTEFEAIAIFGGYDGGELKVCAPCGVCRQVMIEFCDPDEFTIFIGTSKDNYEAHTLREMLPFSFSPKELNR